jgi:hypothetical protein
MIDGGLGRSGWCGLRTLGVEPVHINHNGAHQSPRFQLTEHRRLADQFICSYAQEYSFNQAQCCRESADRTHKELQLAPSPHSTWLFPFMT